MSQLLLILFIILTSIVIVAELSLRYLSNKYFAKKIEFPKSDLKLLEKFKNYDPELGWEPKPVVETKDTGHHRAKREDKKKPTYSIHEDGSRSSPVAESQLSGQLAEFFGGSATFCRDVEDDETFQYYLEKDFGTGPCKNYGVGSYGIDQSYLRAKRRMQGGGIAVLYMPLLSLYRITAVYKH